MVIMIKLRRRSARSAELLRRALIDAPVKGRWERPFEDLTVQDADLDFALAGTAERERRQLLDGIEVPLQCLLDPDHAIAPTEHQGVAAEEISSGAVECLLAA